MIWSDELAKPFPEGVIHWRPGSMKKDQTAAIALAYIDARDAMERLDSVMGPEYWQCRYPFEGCCEIGINIGMIGEPHWIWKSNGAGQTNIEGEKGQYSDAFKRAAVMWGIGRYLYDLPNVWGELDQYKRFKETPKLPQWATPGGWNRIPSSQKKAVYEQSVEALENGDHHALKTIWDEWSSEDKAQLWHLFDSKQRAAMKELAR